MRNRILAGLMAGAVLAVASPAAALEAECLWQGLSSGTREAIIEGYRQGGAETLVFPQLNDRDLDTLFRRCGVTHQNSRVAGTLLAAVMIERAAEAVLSERHGLKPAALDEAWRAAPADARAAATVYARALGTGQRGVDSTAFEALVDAMLTRLRLPPEAREHLQAWVYGRANREDQERS